MVPVRAACSAARATASRWAGATASFLDAAAEDGAQHVEVVQLDGVGVARPQARHLPGADHHAALGKHPLQLTGFPDAAVGRGQTQVPLHWANPFHRSATRRCPVTQASSTWVVWTWMYRAVVPVQACPSSMPVRCR